MESIYKVSRLIKKREQSLYNALRSIYDDSLFVGEIAQLWPQLPVLANLRCGLWYAPYFDGHCYFKSTDGHNGNWSFNVTRLNLHVALLAEALPGLSIQVDDGFGGHDRGNALQGTYIEENKTGMRQPNSCPANAWVRARYLPEKGGCLIVDATRKGKRFPDSMSKTIPIWACVVNRALADFRDLVEKRALKPQNECRGFQGGAGVDDSTSGMLPYASINRSQPNISQLPVLDVQVERAAREFQEWDCALHFPLWVSETEKSNIQSLMDRWVDDLKTCGADLTTLAKTLTKPLRTLWVSQKTVVWLNEVADVASWDFTPIILVSASRPVSCMQRMSDAEFSWNYIPGAADDEESWARGLTPSLFWKHSYDLVNGGPEDCNRSVSEIVERDRVYKALRGRYAPQVRVKSAIKLSAPEEGRRDISDAVDRNTATTCSLVNDKTDGDCASPCTNGSQSGLEDSMSSIPELKIYNQSSKVRSFISPEQHPPDIIPGLHWIGLTGLAVGSSACCQVDGLHQVVDCVIDCGSPAYSTCSDSTESYLHIRVLISKFDRLSLQSHLPEAVKFAMGKLASGLTLLISCPDGEDVSVCVCLAILLSCFDSMGRYCGSAGPPGRNITKADVRESLVYLASFHSGARPSRGNLKQVYNYLLNAH